MCTEHKVDIQRALAFIAENHKDDPCKALGYAWATLANLAEAAGLPRPTAPWRTQPESASTEEQ